MANSRFSGPIISANGIKAGTTGTTITKIVKGSVSVNPGNCADNDIVEVTLTITGAAVGDVVIMNPPAAGQTAGLGVCGARVSATDEVKLRLINVSGGAVDEGALTYDYILIRS